MAKAKSDSRRGELALLDRVKALSVTAMLSDDALQDELVLTGGDAIALIHKLTSRESVDLDSSMRHDFPEGFQGVRRHIEVALLRTFPGDCFPRSPTPAGQ